MGVHQGGVRLEQAPGNAGILAEGVEFLDQVQVHTQVPGRRRGLSRGFFPPGGRQPAMHDRQEDLACDAVPASPLLAFLARQQRGKGPPPLGVQALSQGGEQDRFDNAPHQTVPGKGAAVPIEDGGNQVNAFARAQVLIFHDGHIRCAPADIEVQNAGLGRVAMTAPDQFEPTPASLAHTPYLVEDQRELGGYGFVQLHAKGGPLAAGSHQSAVGKMGEREDVERLLPFAAVGLHSCAVQPGGKVIMTEARRARTKGWPAGRPEADWSWQ